MESAIIFGIQLMKLMFIYMINFVVLCFGIGTCFLIVKIIVELAKLVDFLYEKIKENGE